MTAKKGDGGAAKAGRDAKLAAQLRRNLAERKAQRRGREATREDGDEPKVEHLPPKP